MCCFSGPVKEVSATRIFARMLSPGRQGLAYQMQFAADAAVAMILPIPVLANSADDAVRFISLEGYPTMFADMYKPFAPPVALGPPSRSHSNAPQTLKVHAVGAFVASFAPRLADFARLDPQFRMPSGTLDRIPEYADWGFAVFQLAATRTPSEVHPMAFEFPTRDASRLFFPTVHVHDGAVHEHAEFRHHLYLQGADHDRAFHSSQRTTSHFMKPEQTHGLVDPARWLSHRRIYGKQPNRDQWVTLPAAS